MLSASCLARGATVCALVGLMGCEEPSRPRETASHIFHGGEIVTLDPDVGSVEALAIAGGRVLGVGKENAVMETRGPGTEMIDLQGNVLLPSLKDHHLHLMNIGFSVLNRERHETLFLDLSTARSIEDVAHRVAQSAAQTPEGQWVLGKGWSQGAWGTGVLPTHHVLSEAAPRHPVYLARADGHCGWANAEALRLAGIDRSTPDPPSGAIGRLEDGSLSGILLERANELVLAHVPEPGDEDVSSAFREGARAVAAQGVTEVYDAGFLAFPGVVGLNVGLGRYLERLEALDKAETLPVRVHLMIPWPSSLAESVIENPIERQRSPNVRVSHIKIFADGALGSRGAFLRQPYADDPKVQGVPWMRQGELEGIVLRVIDSGLDVATHAIGDGAVGMVLDAYESVIGKRAGVDPRKLRIEHFSFASSADMEKAARLGVVLVVQPGFVYPDEAGRAMEDARLGPERVSGAYAWATLTRLGAVIADSSDDFTFPGHPLWNFYAAVTRKTPSGQPPQGWHREESLSREEALGWFTRFHRAGGEEPIPGRLEPGGPADLVILSGNPLTIDEPGILQLRVEATWLGGRVTYHDEFVIIGSQALLGEGW